MKKYFQASWTKLGFKKIKPFKLLTLIVSYYLIYLIISLVILMAIIYWNIKIPGYQIKASILKLFGTDTFSMIKSGLLVVIIAPFIEEIIFRGLLLQTLCKKIGTVFGSLITAVIFSILHFPWQGIIPAFILGLIINGLFIKSKTLWATIGFHILNNAVAFTIVILLEKGVISVDSLKVF